MNLNHISDKIHLNIENTAVNATLCHFERSNEATE